MSEREDNCTVQETNGWVFESLPHADAALVLGAGLRRREHDGKLLAGQELKMRALAALELLKHGKIDAIIVTGGSTAKDSLSTEADVIEEYLVEMGVPREKIFKETTSKNTAQNIENCIGILTENGIKTVLVVTNEFHGPRAKQLFQNIMKKHGLDLEGAPISAEAVLNARSAHYNGLTAHYTFPESLKHCPRRAIKMGMRELLRRILIAIDPGDTIAKALANRVR